MSIDVCFTCGSKRRKTAFLRYNEDNKRFSFHIATFWQFGMKHNTAQLAKLEKLPKLLENADNDFEDELYQESSDGYGDALKYTAQ